MSLEVSSLRELDETRQTLLLVSGSRGGHTAELLSIAAECQIAFPEIASVHFIIQRDAAVPSDIDPDVSTWIDAPNRLHGKLHANQPTLILIRPDGYIGFRGQPADGAELFKFMDSYLLRRN